MGVVDTKVLSLWSPISHHDIASYEAVSRIALRDWERRAILKMDRVWLAHINQPPEDRERNKSARPMSPDLFDALFK